MAAQQSTIASDLRVLGNLSAGSQTPIVNSVNNASIQAASGIDPLKVNQQVRKIIADNYTTVAASFRRTIWRVYGTTHAVTEFRIGIAGTAAAGAATVTVDLFKNGATILTSTVVIDNSIAQRGTVAATLAAGAASLVAGDVIEISVVAAAGGGTLPQGFFATLVGVETPA